jgi:hypothetical protein
MIAGCLGIVVGALEDDHRLRTTRSTSSSPTAESSVDWRAERIEHQIKK